MNIWGHILRLFGWKVDITAPIREKCVICVAPHTSNWDFPLGLFAYKSLGRKANFLMKEFWFFFPLKYMLKALGGIPVARKSKHSSLTSEIVEKFKHSSYLNLAVTPEGTRGKRKDWKTGFLYIAYGANVPVQLGVIDYLHKEIIIRDELEITGNVECDMRNVKEYYARFADVAKYPEKFSI